MRSFFLTPTSGLNLSILRFVVFVCLAISTSPRELNFFSSLSPEMMGGISGVTWLIPAYGGTEVLFQFYYLFVIFCALAAVGFFTRASALAATVLGIYVLGYPHLFGKLSHQSPHLIWFGFLLAASPCDIISIDAWIKSRWLKKKVPSIHDFCATYTLPIRIAWLLFGIIYFFPGLAKVRLGGADWFLSDNLRDVLSYVAGGPIARRAIDLAFSVPYASLIASIVTVIFELTFIFAIFAPAIRKYYVALGFCFHSVVALLIDFPFITLRACYVVFIDWYKLVRNPRPNIIAFGRPQRIQLYATLLVGGLLLIVNSYMGVMNRWAWPFTAYPSFHRIVGQEERTAWYEIRAYEKKGKPLKLLEVKQHLSDNMGRQRWENRKRIYLVPDDPVARYKEVRIMWKEFLKIDPTLARARKVVLKIKKPEQDDKESRVLVELKREDIKPQTP